ncbi:hypothetical protein BJY21_002379 [Kineosphaera limosa]|uniref:Putative AraC family transcriptional regulator n=1 Tax=Kineosphaera limosa NBRC 100340 TaxID=1184609 RepID=K6VK47_9MICO|nr:AraC family transcriptional regulator [Kineosphaera limosa]NYE01195.1 hypothetical protein [Kineosphaera limosa]GAB96603.1 putative AraC family transcriptional regulator [Kineosphaera limosa NBRC 100340]
MTPLVSPGEPSLTTIPIGALGALPQVLAGLGTEPWALLRPFGIGPRSFDEPLMALPAATHGAILQAAVEASGCDHIGLLLGRNATLGNTGPLRFVMLNAPTVRAAIEALMAFGPIWYPAIALTMHQEAEYARFSVAIRRACAGDDQILTGYLAANVRILQIVLGQTWHPVSVRVAHRTPASVAPFRSFFGCPVYFDQGVNEVWFPRELLGQTRRALTADVELDTFLRTQLAELRSKDDFVGQVRETIRSLLPRGECTAERAAALFHLHRQTLHRHLARRGAARRSSSWWSRCAASWPSSCSPRRNCPSPRPPACSATAARAASRGRFAAGSERRRSVGGSTRGSAPPPTLRETPREKRLGLASPLRRRLRRR